jgi:tRNA U38,U39,U40 pseudouridine synthase TruA
MVHGRGTMEGIRFRALLKHQCRMMIATSIPSTKHKIPTSLVAGAKAAAEATRRVETTAENFMVDDSIYENTKAKSSKRHIKTVGTRALVSDDT